MSILTLPTAIYILASTGMLLLIVYVERLDFEMETHKYALLLFSSSFLLSLVAFFRALDPDNFVIWDNVYSLMILSTGVSWFIFTAKFSDLEIGNKVLGSICSLFFVFSIAMITNSAHGMWGVGKPIYFDGMISYSYHPESGIIRDLMLISSYIMFLTGIGILVRDYVFSEKELKRKQTMAFLIGSIVPILGNFIYQIYGVSELLPIEPVVLSFAFFTCPTYAYGIIQHNLMSIKPIAGEFLIENLDQGVVIVQDSTIVDSNQKADEIFQDLHGSDAKKQGIPEEIGQEYTEVVQESVCVEKDIYYDCVDQYFEIKISPIDDLKNSVLIIMKDITERKKRQKELSEKNKRLDKFSSIVSHDIRNHLQSGMAFSEMAYDSAENESMKKYTKKSKQSFDRIDNVLNDAKQIINNPSKDDMQTVNLSGIFEQTVSKMDIDDDVSIENSIDMEIKADPASLRRLIENLVCNSLRHGGEEMDRIKIGRIESENQSGFYISDNGCGFPDNADVFKSGFTTSSDGTGLGLDITKSIVDSHNWLVRTSQSSSGGARVEILTNQV